MLALLRLSLVAFLCALAVPAPAQTAAIETALQAATVGERYDGYLGFAGSVPEEVRRQVGAVNIRRRALYTDLAMRRNVTVEAVGIAAGCELLARVAVGQAYLLNDGTWRIRRPGQPAPAPGYCAG